MWRFNAILGHFLMLEIQSIYFSQKTRQIKWRTDFEQKNNELRNKNETKGIQIKVCIRTLRLTLLLWCLCLHFSSFSRTMSRTESIDVWLSVRTNCVMANLSGAETGPIWGSPTLSWPDNFADFFGIWSDWFLGLAAALLYSELSSEVEGGRSSEHEWRAFWWRNGCLGRFLNG